MKDFGRYLGDHILHKQVNKNTYQFVVDKMNQRLNSWKERNISFARRVTLTKSVIQVLSTYLMQTSQPKSICDVIDKKYKDFIWEIQCNLKKFTWHQGRLHASQKPRRSTTIAKNFINNHNDLWMKAMRIKYKCGDNLILVMDLL
ncbi:putative ribonuclease H protein, partial [Mucuna pruriens]